VTRDRGFTLVELLIATALLVTFCGTLMALVTAGESIARAQPDAADLQQRARIGVQAMRRDLLLAGAGLDRGAQAGSLAQFFPALVPSSDGGVTVWYVSGRSAQASLAAAASFADSQLMLQAAGVCPVSQAACAFAPSTAAILFNAGGCHDAVRIDQVGASALLLHAPLGGCAYAAGAPVAQGEVHTYLVDVAARELLRRDESTGLTLPVLDGVESMKVDYFDQAAIDAGPIDPSANPLRIQRVRITLRFVSASGAAAPSLVVSFDVTPPNLQGG
jgi:prepilin-type N-terminal cleavage/methylation domain-containing protein